MEVKLHREGSLREGEAAGLGSGRNVLEGRSGLNPMTLMGGFLQS